MYNQLEQQTTLYLGQICEIERKFTNIELKISKIFYIITRIYFDAVISLPPYLFFFLKPDEYLRAKIFIKKLRNKFDRKIRLIRFRNKEDSLLHLINALFSDVYIHDYSCYFDERKQMDTIVLKFITFEERGIAIGRNGEYIKTINHLLSNHIKYADRTKEVRVKCILTEL